MSESRSGDGRARSAAGVRLEPAGASGRPRVVIVGGGFAGLHAAKALRRAPVDVVLVDKRNHHLFQPLLYQVATAALASTDIARPIRTVLRGQRNTVVLLGEVERVRPDARCVDLAEGGALEYDHLIVAAGLTASYFGHDEWARFAPGLKSLADAHEVRRRMLLAFEAAERDPDSEHRVPWQTFVVVGAGPTGVELAGALREIATRTMVRDFRRTDPSETRVVLVDVADRVLPAFDEELSEAARAMLEARGVEVRTDSKITGVDERGVWLGDERIEARTVIWAAGVRAVAWTSSLGAPLTRDGRVLVNPDLTVPGRPEIQVAGDLAALKSEGEWVPGMAPAAIQEGKHAARNVLRALRGEPLAPFRYRDKGTLATIGRAQAVARVGKLHFAGFVAWLLWLAVHIAWLIGFRNRLVVLIDWAWAYVTYQRSARIVDELSMPRAPEPEAERASREEGAAVGSE